MQLALVQNFYDSPAKELIQAGSREVSPEPDVAVRFKPSPRLTLRFGRCRIAALALCRSSILRGKSQTSYLALIFMVLPHMPPASDGDMRKLWANRALVNLFKPSL